MLLPRDGFTQVFLGRDAFTQKNTQTRGYFYTQMPSHSGAVTECLYTHELLHRASFDKDRKVAFTHTSFYSKYLTQRCFYTGIYLYKSVSLHTYMYESGFHPLCFYREMLLHTSASIQGGAFT